MAFAQLSVVCGTVPHCTLALWSTWTRFCPGIWASVPMRFCPANLFSLGICLCLCCEAQLMQDTRASRPRFLCLLHEEPCTRRRGGRGGGDIVPEWLQGGAEAATHCVLFPHGASPAFVSGVPVATFVHLSGMQRQLRTLAGPHGCLRHFC